jgi:predicted metalloenzyme YecM
LAHRIGSLLPHPGEVPHFAQIHILDSLSPITPAEIHMAHQHGLLNKQILSRLMDIFDDINPYFHIFQTVCERLRETNAIALHLKTVDVPHLDLRRYNRPTAAEVAIIVPGTGEQLVDHREIVLHSRAGPLKRISELYSAYLPLHYPIIHPYGEQGWSLFLHEST